MAVPSMSEFVIQDGVFSHDPDPYVPQPKHKHAHPVFAPFGYIRTWTMSPLARRAGELENLFQIGSDPFRAAIARVEAHAIENRLRQAIKGSGLRETRDRVSSWLEGALEELDEIDGQIIEEGLPAIEAATRGEAVRILKHLDGQAMLPTIYPTPDGEIVIHFQSPGVPAAVLIEIGNDGHAACYSCIGEKNRRARYDDSSDLPDEFVSAQLRALRMESIP